jgi:hypothetical protein
MTGYVVNWNWLVKKKTNYEWACLKEQTYDFISKSRTAITGARIRATCRIL